MRRDMSSFGSFDAACRGKTASWSSWAQAEATARRMRRSRGGNNAPYRCHFCGLYHVGTSQWSSQVAAKARRHRLNQIKSSEWKRGMLDE